MRATVATPPTPGTPVCTSISPTVQRAAEAAVASTALIDTGLSPSSPARLPAEPDRLFANEGVGG